MKTKLPILTAITAILLMSACEKEETDTTPVNPTIKRDTIYIQPTPVVTKTKTEILTYKPWIMEEEYDMEGNVLNIYERGASGNTMNYDNELLTFNQSNTGSFKDIYGNTYPISWNFANAMQTKMTVTIHFPSTSVQHTYNMVQLSDSSFSMTFNRVNPSTGNKVLVTAKRVWKP